MVHVLWLWPIALSSAQFTINNNQIFEESPSGSFNSATIECSSGADCFIQCGADGCFDLTVEAATSRSLTLNCSAWRACDSTTILHGPLDTMRVLCDGRYACDQITISTHATSFIDVQCSGENACDKTVLDVQHAVHLNVSCSTPDSCYRSLYNMDAVDIFVLSGYAERPTINLTRDTLETIDIIYDNAVTVYCPHRSGFGTQLRFDNETASLQCSNGICCPRTLRSPHVYDCAPNEPCVIECSADICAFESLIDASKASSLSLRCDHVSLCQYLEVVCPANGVCDIQCSAPYACQYIDVSTANESSTSVSVLCEADYSCQFMRAEVVVEQTVDITCTAPFACDNSEIRVRGDGNTRVVVVASQTQSLSDVFLNVSHADRVDIVCSGTSSATCGRSQFWFDEVSFVRAICDGSATACVGMAVDINLHSNDSIVVSTDNEFALQNATIAPICADDRLWTSECGPNITVACDSISMADYESDTCTQCSLDNATTNTHAYSYSANGAGWTSSQFCPANVDNDTSTSSSFLEFELFSNPIFLIGAPAVLVFLVIVCLCCLYRCKKDSELYYGHQPQPQPKQVRQPSRLSARYAIEVQAYSPESDVMSANDIESVQDDQAHLPPHLLHSPSMAPTEFMQPAHQRTTSITSFHGASPVTNPPSHESAPSKGKHSHRKHSKLRPLSVSSVDMVGGGDYYGKYAQDQKKEDSSTLRKWLKHTVKLPQYYDAFLENGYKSLANVRRINTEDKLMALGINSKSHRTQLLVQIQLLKEMDDGQIMRMNFGKRPSRKFSRSRTESDRGADKVIAYRQHKDEHDKFRDWLKHKVQLPQYYDQFVSHNYDNLDSIAADIEDETRLIEMGITSQIDRELLLCEIALLNVNKDRRAMHSNLSKKRKSKKHKRRSKKMNHKPAADLELAEADTSEEEVVISIKHSKPKKLQQYSETAESGRNNGLLKDQLRMQSVLGGGRRKTVEKNVAYLESAVRTSIVEREELKPNSETDTLPITISASTQLTGPSSIEMPLHILGE